MNRKDILAREAQLVYSNSAAKGFTPIDNNLNVWSGTLVYTSRTVKNKFVFEIILPDDFPKVPPVVKAITPMQHPDVNSDGLVRLRILNYWRPEFHLYQVIIALKNVMSRIPPVPIGYRREVPVKTTTRIATPIPDTLMEKNIEIETLRQELRELKSKLRENEEELTRLRAKQFVDQARSSSISIKPTESLLNELEAEKMAITDLLTNLEDRYDSGEISIFEYSRLYKKYTKELYIIRKKEAFLKG